MRHPSLRAVRDGLIAALALAGCIERHGATPESADAGRSDLSRLDRAVSDAHLADLAPPDAMSPDAMSPDAMSPDAMPPDAMPPDTMPPDAMPPDAIPPDAWVTPPGSCDDAAPVLGASGQPTGFVRCGDGAIDRVAPSRCAPRLTLNPGCQAEDACQVDADCADAPHGRCGRGPNTDFASCECHYPCVTDDDCAPDERCVCDAVDPLGSRCQPAPCATGADCESGRCGVSVYDAGCGDVAALACRTPEDECADDGDCRDEGTPAWRTCYPAGETNSQRVGLDPAIVDRWRCDEVASVCGRPLRIAARPRLAPPRRGGGWADDAPPAPPLDAAERRRLAAHWQAIAALEHASVASFARFTLQLLALGAPAALVAESQRAAADEVEHARLAYAIASAFAGEAIGPGPLRLDDVSFDADPATVLREVIAEGCVGETLGAAEAAEAARLGADPAIAAACARVAADELRHAALGWRVARWLLDRDPGLAAVARDAMRGAICDAMGGTRAPGADAIDGTSAPIDPVARFGIPVRPALRREAIAGIIAPLARRLLG